MAKKPEYKIHDELFTDGQPRRRIVIDGYLTEQENEDIKARADSAGMSVREYMKECLKNGLERGLR